MLLAKRHLLPRADELKLRSRSTDFQASTMTMPSIAVTTTCLSFNRSLNKEPTA